MVERREGGSVESREGGDDEDWAGVKRGCPVQYTHASS